MPLFLPMFPVSLHFHLSKQTEIKNDLSIIFQFISSDSGAEAKFKTSLNKHEVKNSY